MNDIIIAKTDEVKKCLKAGKVIKDMRSANKKLIQLLQNETERETVIEEPSQVSQPSEE